MASRISSLETYSVAESVVGPWRNRSALTKFIVTPSASLSASKSSNSVLSVSNFCFFEAGSPDEEEDVEGRGESDDLEGVEVVVEGAGEEEEDEVALAFSAACNTIVECWLKRRMRLALFAFDFDRRTCRKIRIIVVSSAGESNACV